MAKSTLETQFKKDILPRLAKELELGNLHAVPRLKKIQVSIGMGKILQGKKDYEEFSNNLALITGQLPSVRKAKKSISNFKLREGLPIGLTVTLRGKRMYDFFNKLVNIVAPRIRDFRGFPLKSFDGRGNYTLGIKEHTVFPEINPDDVTQIHGLEITIVSSTKNNREGEKLLSAFNFPFKKTSNN